MGSLTPVRVHGSHGAGAIAIAAGDRHTLTLQDDGTVWAWGADDSGQLGDGTTGDPSCFCRTMVVQVHGLSGVIAISAGWGHSLALKSDGTVWAWGYDHEGELGDGTLGGSPCYCRLTPVRVLGLTGVIAISAASSHHSLALKSDGTVWAWGADFYGQLGDGTLGVSYCGCRSAHVQVLGLHGVIAIASGVWHSLALKSDGTVWAWGDDEYGQLGDGIELDRTNFSIPRPVQTQRLANVTAISAGGKHSLALRVGT
jgi:alpha-tubulin suppressor-like RCC1 family protein